MPADRPTLIIAEGLLMYLPEDDVRQLLQRVTDRFPTGELLSDVAAPWLARLVRIQHWGLRDPHEVERWLPRARFVAEASIVGSPYAAAIPTPAYRRMYRVLQAISPLRDILRLERFSY